MSCLVNQAIQNMLCFGHGDLSHLEICTLLEIHTNKRNDNNGNLWISHYFVIYNYYYWFIYIFNVFNKIINKK